MDKEIKIKNNINISHTPLNTSYTKDDYLHKDINLEGKLLQKNVNSNKQLNIHIQSKPSYQQEYQKNIPNHQIETNYGSTDRQTNLDINRQYVLKPTINAGEFTGKCSKPMVDRMQQVIETPLSEKALMNKKIMMMQQNRH